MLIINISSIAYLNEHPKCKDHFFSHSTSCHKTLALSYFCKSFA